jgi:hypothetical protein
VFATQHGTDAGPAILGAPAFLSRLQPAEVEIVRRQYETSRNPQVADAKREAVDALEHCEAGFRNAVRIIRERGGLESTSNGVCHHIEIVCAGEPRASSEEFVLRQRTRPGGCLMARRKTERLGAMPSVAPTQIYRAPFFKFLSARIQEVARPMASPP